MIFKMVIDVLFLTLTTQFNINPCYKIHSLNYSSIAQSTTRVKSLQQNNLSTNELS